MLVLGDFADETKVVLPASYVTFASTAPAVSGVSKSGWLWALSNGTRSAAGQSAANPGRHRLLVGQPATDHEQALADLGLLAYPRAITLPQTNGWQPLPSICPT